MGARTHARKQQQQQTNKQIKEMAYAQAHTNSHESIVCAFHE